MTGMHMVFVYPPANRAAEEVMRSHFKMCLGSAYIIAFLEEKGWKVKPFLSDQPVNLTGCVERIMAMHPSVVGFSVDYANYSFCCLIAEMLKSVNHRLVIVFGGFMPTIHGDEILETIPAVDVCCRGEGEETCHVLLSRLDEAGFVLGRAILEDVAGITFRRDGRVYRNRDCEIISQHGGVPGFLDRYPSPYLRGIVSHSRLGVVTARGCNQHCIYCVCPVMSRGKIATHSVGRVIEELDYISRFIVKGNSRVVDIFDDTFTLLPGRALEICQEIRENRIKLSLACTTRCDKVDEELLLAMKEAGFVSVEFSLESAVPRILRNCGKVSSPGTKQDDTFEKEKEYLEAFKRNVVLAKKIGIKNVYSSIVLGLPGETLVEGRQTMAFIESMKGYIDFYGYNVLQVHRGTPLFDWCGDYGIRTVQRPGRVHYDTITSYDTAAIPPVPISSSEVQGVNQDIDNLKTLAFLMPYREIGIRDYFNRVIFRGDQIFEQLVRWLQQVLAFNGTFIQVYSNEESARQFSRSNEELLHEWRCPTHYYAGYFPVQGKRGGIKLVSVRTWRLGTTCGRELFLESPVHVLAMEPGIHPLYTVAIDRVDEPGDARELYGLLEQMRGGVDGGAGFDMPIFPYFSSLCRWEEGAPNCRLLDIALIEGDGSVKTCWNGEPIGAVGMDFHDIRENVEYIRMKAEKRRGCRVCVRSRGCSLCLFPLPLEENEYCKLKRKIEIKHAADILRTQEIFKPLAWAIDGFTIKN